MTLLEVIKALEDTAKVQPSVKMVVANDIFRLNAIPDAKYGVFAWTQQQHTIEDGFALFAFALFYVDRLTEDKGNEAEVQSVGVSTLANIIASLEDRGIFPEGSWTAQTFNQRFMDECAGVYASVRFRVPLTTLCADDYFPHSFNNDFNDDFNE